MAIIEPSLFFIYFFYFCFPKATKSLPFAARPAELLGDLVSLWCGVGSRAWVVQDGKAAEGALLSEKAAGVFSYLLGRR